VADVSDQGLPAAMIMAALSIMIRTEAGRRLEADKILESVNASMYDLMAEEGFFATICLGKYWPCRGNMEYSAAGHFPPLWIAKNRLKEVSASREMSLGVLPAVSYSKREITLQPGESLLFVTDGVLETENDRKEFFGRDRVIAGIESGDGPPWGAGILKEINRWKGVSEASDDLTMLEIWRE
jgi:serine phosphatase RsbU (regulator of sigma subunit)